MRWIDDHCHLHDTPEGDADVAAAKVAGVEAMIAIGTDLAESQQAIAVARKHEGVRATVGLHPHDAKNGLDGIAELLGEPEVVAVGECGLDYHYDHSPREVQREVFAAQIGLAHEHDLALVVHTRAAWDDTFAVLDAAGWPARTVIHCFSGGPMEAERCLASGAFLSFSGVITFKNASDVRRAAEVTPLDRLLVETDAPFLAPVPHRGDRNQPAWVALVGEKVAEVKNLPVHEVAATTWDTAHRVYRLA